MQTNSLTLDYFCTLSFSNQLFLVNMDAVFLLSKKTTAIERMLFYLDGFYVEAFIDTATGRVLRMKSFTDVAQLDYYLDQISIDELTVSA